MADTVHSDTTPPQVDFAAHARDWSRMTMMLKWGAIASFIVAAIVVVIIAS